MEKLTLITSISINAPQAEVWKGLTDPEIVKQYFFGTTVNSDWKPGSSITFSGEWEGKAYQDKGTIKEIEPGKYVKYTYWSSMSGTEDKPENYADVSYSLDENDGVTTLILTQDNIKDEASRKHSEENWQMVLGGLKKILEK
ncbi:SRPBCC domain-containing protein [Mucilaginibacter achroorhodeus]|uniref:SRPBCC domain-containing protein n=1 Tax=Mucilaginibacter achroorhodeus TaxID=2599294 RepID=A0A563U2Q2_9SPHI|nr:SRPBCC family protein [Mucilaginibacter achroorhodeus]TWR25620.1 SRPBCC domain-containing protein [Mucilaginibacter achroorhodeus]